MANFVGILYFLLKSNEELIIVMVTGYPEPAAPSKKGRNLFPPLLWAVRDSNPRPPGCKPGALNQLS